MYPSGLDAKHLEIQLPLIPNSFMAVCHANISFVLHFVAHASTKTSDVTFERQISNRRQKNRNRKRELTPFSEQRTTEFLQRVHWRGLEEKTRKRGKKRETERGETDKRSRSDENAAAPTLPAKGGTRDVCRMAQRDTCKGSLCRGAECKRLYVYGINGWRRSPAGSQGKHSMTGERSRSREPCVVRPFLADTRIERQLLSL